MSRTTARPRKVSTMFADLEPTSVRRSIFNRSHGYKSTFNGDYLYPVFLDEVLPGDQFSVSMSQIIRMTTPITPFMDNVRLQIHYFFVPNRLVWDHWEDFLGANTTKAGIQETSYLVPAVALDGVVNPRESGSLWDYFGLPPAFSGVYGGVVVSALPFRCYNLIWNEWYRDENLQDPVPVPTDDGPDEESDTYKLLKRNKKHDYFTSALPWPQKGPSVQIGSGPISQNINVLSKGWSSLSSTGMISITGTNSDVPPGHVYAPMTPYIDSTGAFTANLSSLFHPGKNLERGIISSYKIPLNIADNTVIGTVDFTTGSPLSVNNLREAFQVQKFYERQARGGTRYTELIRSFFGVVSPDARLQRPEFLGSQTFTLNVNQVVQTSSTDTSSPQGNLSAYGLFSGSSRGFSKSFVEHGYILGLLSITADLTYQQGVNRMWTRRGKFDFYWPTFAHLGEQPVYNYELFLGTDSKNAEVFGYQERYAEYRYYPSMITGLMRSNVSSGNQTLDVWHLAQDFDTRPLLNSSFIEYDTPFKRVSAVQDQPMFYGDLWFNVKAVRPIPVYGTPGLVDHF